MCFVDCFDFILQEDDMFGDPILHPDGVGFAHYAERLIEAIRGEIVK